MIQRINHTVHTTIPLKNEGSLWVVVLGNMPYTSKWRYGPTAVVCIIVVKNVEIGSFSFDSYLEFKRFKDSLKCR